jgi:hypothetical protein
VLVTSPAPVLACPPFQATAGLSVTPVICTFTGTLTFMASLAWVANCTKFPPTPSDCAKKLVPSVSSTALVIAPTDWVFVCVMVCLVTAAWPYPLTAALPFVATAAPSSLAAFASTVLTSQHMVTTQHVTTGQQHAYLVGAVRKRCV